MPVHSLGNVPAGITLYLMWTSHDLATGANETMSGLATTDVEIYKNGGTTQRASDNGYALLDTDGIDFDGTTGLNGISIDLADNSDAGFYAAGGWYDVVVGPVTIDTRTVNIHLATFRIVTAEGSAGTPVADVTRIAGSAVSTSTAQLGVNVVNAAGTAWGSGAITAASIAADAITAAKIADGAIDANTFASGAITATAIATDAIGAAELADGAITAATFAAGAIDATAIANGAIDAAAFAAGAVDAAALAADAVAEIADGVWDEAMSGHRTLGTFGQLAAALGLRTGEINDGAATTTAFVVDGFTEATDDHFNGMQIAFTSGANLGEVRTITDYTGATQTVTLGQALTDAPADNDDFVLLPGEFGGGDLAKVLRLFITILDQSTGQVDNGSFAAGAIDASAIATDAIGAAEIADGAITAATFAAGAIDATAIAANAITAAKVADGTIDAATFAAGAIDATAIAANAIGASELAADAVAEIADQVWDEARAGHVAAGSFGEGVASVQGNVTGSVGSVTGAVGSVTGAVGSVAGNVDGNVTGSVGSLAAQAKADVNAEVLDVLNVDTFAEPGQATPAATTTLVTKIGYLFKSLRNRKTQTSSQFSLYNDDATTIDQKAAVSDDGTTTDVGELATGP